jgi:CBS domain-containing protein
MKVADLMQTDVRTVTADMPVSEAIVALEEARVSGLPVVDARNRVIGVVSSTDIIGTQAETLSAEERGSCWRTPGCRRS